MKKSMYIWGTVVFSLWLYAGGDTSPYAVQNISIETPQCKANKVYIEKDAKLMWQDQSYTESETGAYKRNHTAAKSGSWQHAKNYCASLDYQGYSDWRLPTSDELRNVHHKHGQVFTYYRGDDFWTSTPTTENRYYVVYPVDAYQYKRSKKESNYIRCVRCWIPVKKQTLSGMINTTLDNVVERD